MKYLIVGLGNIGPDYQDTRHNIGFNILDAFARASNVFFEDHRYGFTCEVKLKGHVLILLKPSTFMNLSGNAVRYWMQKEKIPLENVLVIVDDLALPFGTLRLKPNGSDAGHNGLRNIQEVLGTIPVFGLESEMDIPKVIRCSMCLVNGIKRNGKKFRKGLKRLWRLFAVFVWQVCN
jgi:aminoacyl-tRNA hydrolase